MLVELSIGCSYYDDSVEHLLSTLSCCASQLEILCLVLSKNSLIELEAVGLCKFTELPKLKKLVIEYILGSGQENLVWLTAFIRASPFLEEFVLNYKWYKLPKKDREVKDPMSSPHHHLKVFKFNGYYGRTNDAELLGYIIKNCIELQKIVIDSSSGEYPETEKYDVKRNTRKNAEQLLQPLLHQHVELVIL